MNLNLARSVEIITNQFRESSPAGKYGVFAAPEGTSRALREDRSNPQAQGRQKV